MQPLIKNKNKNQDTRNLKAIVKQKLKDKEQKPVELTKAEKVRVALIKANNQPQMQELEKSALMGCNHELWVQTKEMLKGIDLGKDITLYDMLTKAFQCSDEYLALAQLKKVMTYFRSKYL